MIKNTGRLPFLISALSLLLACGGSKHELSHEEKHAGKELDVPDRSPIVKVAMHLIKVDLLQKDRSDAARAFFAVDNLGERLVLSGWVRNEGLEIGRPDYLFQWRRSSGDDWKDEPADAGSYLSAPDKIYMDSNSRGILLFMVPPEIQFNTLGAEDFRVCVRQIEIEEFCSTPFRI